MLVLSRKMGQELVIGDNIRITVSRIGGNRVTLGINAPSDVRIVRGELERIVRSFELELDVPSEPSEVSELAVRQDGPVSTPWVETPTVLADMPRHIH